MTRVVLVHVITAARFTVLITVTALIVACASQQPVAGPPNSLVTGTVTAGPMSPGARPGVPATRPVPGAAVEALRGNQVIATTRTDGDGRYLLRLRPGTYLIRAQYDKYLTKQKSEMVTLSTRQKLIVNLVFDTGIS